MAQSRYQEGIVKRYYQNRDTIALQNLEEAASDLFLCDDSKKALRLWDRVAKALKHTEAQPAQVQKILAARDVTELGRLVNQLATSSRSRANSPPPPPVAPPAQAPPPAPTATPPRAAPPVPSEEPSNPLDAQELKKAMKAFRKRLKLTRLDEESKLGRNPLTSGKASGVVAITPPNQYPRAIWDELVKQGRLKGAGTGFYALVE